MSDADASKPASGSAADIATEVGSLPSSAAPRHSDPELWRVRDGVLNVLFGDPIPTRLLGRYTLVRKIGAGGMGEVHLAEDPQLHRRVAIKLLPAWENEGRDVTRKLLHEARAIARLAHPHVVEVFDVGVHAGVPFIVMELVEGGTLAEWLAACERSTAEIVAALLEAGAGLAAAHHAGVLHRDFKPANVLVGKDGRMRVADFGLALDAPRQDTADDAVDTEAPTLELGGTPAFMPPEQHAALPLDARADVYAFCVTAHLACYGVLPFRGSLAAICAAKLGYDGSPPSGRTLDRRLHDVIARGLHPDRERRWPTMDALCEALARTQRPRSKRALVIAGIAAITTAGIVWSSAREPAPCDADAALAGIWDRSRRDALARRPIVAASPRGEQLLGAIDDEAARWRAAWQAACEGAPTRRDAAMACLGRSRQELDTTLAMFGQGDPDIDGRAIELLRGRDDPSACNEVRAPSNDSPERAAILAELGAIDANLRVGRHAEADAAASALLGRARAQGDAATIAAVALASARARSELGDGQAAHDRASETLWTAIALGDDRLAYDAAFELVWIAGVDLGEPQVADDFAQTAEASLVRLGDDPRERMRLAKQLGGVWGVARDFTRARAELGKARALAEQLGEERTAIDVRGDLATLDFHENDPVRAVSELREVVAWYERELGDRHPRVANTLGNLAQAELLAGDGKAARATVTRAVTLARAAVGDRHPSTIELLGVQGHVLTMLDDVPGALAVSREALASLSELYGPDDRRLTGIETRLADLLARTGDFDGAIAHAEHALAINELTYGAESAGTADSVHYLARVRGMKGDRRADASFERAASIYAALGDVESEVTVLNDHVFALDEQKRSDEALAHSRAAWTRAQQLPEDSMSRASTGMKLAMLDEAMPLAERRALVAKGRDVWRSVGVDPATIAIADAWLSNHPEPPARIR